MSASSMPQVVDLVGCSLGRQPHCLSPKDLSISRSIPELESCSAVQAAALASCTLGSQSLGLSAQSQPTHNATHLLPHCAGGGGGYGGREEANPFEAADKSRAEADNLFSNDNTGIDFDAYDDIPVEATGNDVPAAINTFADVDLGEALAVNVSFQAQKASCMTHCACCVPDGGLPRRRRQVKKAKCNVAQSLQHATCNPAGFCYRSYALAASVICWGCALSVGASQGVSGWSPNGHAQPRCPAFHLAPAGLSIA